MVDWIIEVFGNYSTTSNHDTFFRALGIMDLFLKKSGKYINYNFKLKF